MLQFPLDLQLENRVLFLSEDMLFERELHDAQDTA
jgi:hypothetical protein